MTNLSIRMYAFVTAAMASLAERTHSDERGQDLLEWVLLSGLVAAGIIGVLAIFTPFLNSMVTNIGHCIDFTNNTACSPGF